MGDKSKKGKERNQKSRKESWRVPKERWKRNKRGRKSIRLANY